MGFGAGAGSLVASERAVCPAFPWQPHDGGAQGGRKVFMQSDCAACHSMLPYAGGLRETARGDAEAKVAEIVVANQEQPAIQSAATYAPDLTVTTKVVMLDLLRRNNLYTARELKEKMAALPTPVWLQFLQPHMSAPHAA